MGIADFRRVRIPRRRREKIAVRLVRVADQRKKQREPARLPLLGTSSISVQS
jgi:hypothetical protein